MTNDAGPQLFSDCHTCFISSNAAAAGAASAEERPPLAGPATASSAGSVTWVETDVAVSAGGAGMR